MTHVTTNKMMFRFYFQNIKGIIIHSKKLYYQMTI